MTDAAFSATYSDFKLVRTRGVVQIVFEVPLSEEPVARRVLGGMPDPAKERWFGIAALQPAKEKQPPTAPGSDTARAKRDWKDLQPAQQAGIRCAEPVFRAFLREVKQYDPSDEKEAAEAVRDMCGVNSRVELGTDHRARVIWHSIDEEFQAWKALEHA